MSTSTTSPSPTPAPVVTVGSNLSISQVLSVVGAVVTADVPVIVQSFPSPTVQLGFTLGELAIDFAQQIAALIQALHTKNTAGVTA